MPILDGIGLCQEIARDEILRAAGHKIILMSSTVRLTSVDVPLTTGQLNKPFTRQQLLQAVEAAQRANVQASQE